MVTSAAEMWQHHAAGLCEAAGLARSSAVLFDLGWSICRAKHTQCACMTNCSERNY